MMRSNIKRVIFSAAIAAAVFGSMCAPSQAADLGPYGARRAVHARSTWHASTWRDRCAFAGYYCLYAEYGFVYHYPFDDRPIATGYYARRHRYRS